MKKYVYFPAILIWMVSIISITIAAYGYDEARSIVKVSGDYGMAIGITPQAFLWKKANGDYQEKNWRYISEQYLGPNTYDPRIFDRYRLEIKTETNTPWNAYTEIKIDPWSFVGVGRETVHNAWNDYADIEYKYWEATGKVINESFRTSLGNIVGTNELKVIDGKITHHRAASGLTDWVPPAPAFDLSLNRSVEIDYIFRPIRKLWVEYKEEPLYIKIFPMADQAEAFSSDDPLHLSNNHVYWAPSPWLWTFYPGKVFANANRDQERAQWDWDLAWFTEDSNRNYLTFLRGASVAYSVEDLATVNITAATPMGLWDYYEDATNMPMAARLVLNPSGRVQVGTTYTARYGVYKQELRASNHVMGLDTLYAIGDKTNIFEEYAVSYDHIKHANDENQRHWGYAYTYGIKSIVDPGPNNQCEWDLTFTLMDQHFSPRLSDYRDTRVDRDWGRHIWFDPISEDDMAARIGNSVDINRYVIGGNVQANFAGQLLECYINLRNVHDTYDDKFIENIIRCETTCNPVPHLQLKGLALHRKYPKSLGNWDNRFRDRYTDEPWRNFVMEDGNNTDMMTFSGGAKVDFWESKLVVYGIFETSNDPQDFPRGILNNAVTNMTAIEDNITFNSLVVQAYQQNLFDLPEYQFYNIYKGVVSITPVENFNVKFTHVTNGNRYYAPLLDSNHNHDAVDFSLVPFKDITVNLGYSYSRIIDLRRAIDTAGGNIKFEPHHNFYARMNCDLKKNQQVTLEFGEFWLQDELGGVFGTRRASTRVSVIDTVKIFRIFYQGKF